VPFVPKKKFDVAGARFVREYCRSHGIQILHLFNNKAIGTGLLAARGLDVKVVTYRGQTGNVHRWDPVAWMTHLNPRIDRVVCVSRATAADLARRRLDPDSVVAIYKGHDPGWYDVEPADLSALGLPPDAFAVAVVANYRRRKGIEYVVESSHYLPEGAPVHYLLAGAGHDNPGVLKRISESPAPGHFHLLGHRRDAPAIAAASQATVLAATKREGLPKTVIESMVYGVPPIVTDTGGSAELVLHGETGIVVPPRDAKAIGEAITWMLEHPGERLEMGRRARERIASAFHVRETVEAHLDLYRQLLGT
jgi:glycosyltransferase involved in cell wall biosynthesis